MESIDSDPMWIAFNDLTSFLSNDDNLPPYRFRYMGLIGRITRVGFVGDKWEPFAVKMSECEMTGERAFFRKVYEKAKGLQIHEGMAKELDTCICK